MAYDSNLYRARAIYRKLKYKRPVSATEREWLATVADKYPPDVAEPKAPVIDMNNPPVSPDVEPDPIDPRLVKIETTVPQSVEELKSPTARSIETAPVVLPVEAKDKPPISDAKQTGPNPRADKSNVTPINQAPGKRPISAGPTPVSSGSGSDAGGKKKEKTAPPPPAVTPQLAASMYNAIFKSANKAAIELECPIVFPDEIIDGLTIGFRTYWETVIAPKLGNNADETIILGAPIVVIAEVQLTKYLRKRKEKKDEDKPKPIPKPTENVKTNPIPPVESKPTTNEAKRIDTALVKYSQKTPGTLGGAISGIGKDK